MGELARTLGGVLDEGLAQHEITALASPDGDHDEHALIPVFRPRYTEAARRATGVLLVVPSLAERFPPGRRWQHPQPAWVVASLLGPDPEPDDERHLALLDPGASIDATARIGAGAVIRAGAEIGPGVVVEPRAIIWGRTRLERDARVGAGSVIGRPGFGWTQGPAGLLRTPHRGGVVVEPEADIGALCTVDAGVLEPTRIGRAARLDSHVHVGHGVTIGEGVFVAAQSGFAGSVRVGRGAQIGGQVGVADHLTIGEEARVAAKSGVIGDVPARGLVAGYPAIERGRWLRALARLFAVEPRHRNQP